MKKLDELKLPCLLLDKKGKMNREAGVGRIEFEIRQDQSGILLKSFEIGDEKYTCELMKHNGVLQYKPVRWGKGVPGAHQAGIHRIKDSDGQEKIALISDRRINKGEWQIFIQGIADTEDEMRRKIDNDIGVEYLTAFLEFVENI